MLIDNELVLADAQAVTADAGTTNVINLGVTGRRIGSGEPMALVLFVDVAADFTTGDEAYELEVQTDDDVAFGSATELIAITKTAAQLSLNSVHVIAIDPQWTFEKYTRVRFDVGGTTPTVTGTLALMPWSTIRKWKNYGNNYTITH